MQVEKLKLIVEEMQIFSSSLQTKRSGQNSTGTDTITNTFGESINGISSQRIGIIIQELLNMPITVPLLSASGIGIAVKKFIKTLRVAVSSQEQKNCNYNQVYYSEWANQLEVILQHWKDMASQNGVDMQSKNQHTRGNSETQSQSLTLSVSGKSRHTSDEQHAQDIIDVQKCNQWRELFDVLSAREQKVLKTHGEKMRKIRESLEVGRPKISTAATKHRARILTEGGGIQHAGSTCSGKNSQINNNLAKLKQECNVRTSIILGQACSGAVKRSFGSAVSAAMGVGKKTRMTPPKASNKDQKITGVSRVPTRYVILKDGKQMKLPKTEYQKIFRRGL